MCPAEGKRHWAVGALRVGEATIGSIAVGLQYAGVALQQRRSVFAAAPRRVAVDHRRRCPAAPWPVVTGERPEVALLGAASPGIEDWHRRLVGEEFLRMQHLLAH